MHDLPYDSNLFRTIRDLDDAIRSINDSLDLIESKGVITPEEKGTVRPKTNGRRAPSQPQPLSSSPVDFMRMNLTSGNDTFKKEEPNKKPWWKFW